SSRRRHTRSDRDWSSDVCSSDLFKRTVPRPARAQHVLDGPTVPPRHESARGPPRGSARLAPGQGLVQVRSNFSQDEASHPQISYSNIEGRGLILNSGRTWTKTRTP